MVTPESNSFPIHTPPPIGPDMPQAQPVGKSKTEQPSVSEKKTATTALPTISQGKDNTISDQAAPSEKVLSDVSVKPQGPIAEKISDVAKRKAKTEAGSNIDLSTRKFQPKSSSGKVETPQQEAKVEKKTSQRLPDNFSSKNLNKDNMLALLKQAKEENSPEKVKICLDFIAENMGVKIDVDKNSRVSVKVEKYQGTFEKFSTKLGVLSNIMEGNIALDLSEYSMDMYDVERLLKNHGQLVSSLKLSNFPSVYEDEEVSAKILEFCSHCPNLNHLILDSEITGKNLDLSSLKKLQSLDCSMNDELQTLPVLSDSLKSLNASRCRNLQMITQLPEGLEYLNISGCSMHLAKYPPNLRELDISHTRLNPMLALPNGLEKFRFGNSLLDASLVEFLEHIKLPVSITEIDLSGSNITSLPKLRDHVKTLILNSCNSLETIEGLPEYLEILTLNGSNELREISEIPTSVTTLELTSPKLEELKVPPNLQRLKITGCIGLSMESIFSALPGMINSAAHAMQSNSVDEEVRAQLQFLSGRYKITIVNEGRDQYAIDFKPSNVQFLEKMIEQQGSKIRNLDLSLLKDRVTNELCQKIVASCPNLATLSISSSKVDARDLDFTGLTNLTSLSLNCFNLKVLPKLPEGIKSLSIIKCMNLEDLSGLPNSLESLEIVEGLSLEELPRLPDGLISFKLVNSPRLFKLPKLPDGLKSLDVSKCFNLGELPELPKSLESLDISNCEQLQKLPQLPDSLTTFKYVGCTGLQNQFEKLSESELLAFIPKNQRNDIGEYAIHFLNSGQPVDQSILPHLLKFQEYRERIINAFQTIIKSANEDAPIGTFMDFILDNKTELHLDVSHPLVKYAEKIMYLSGAEKLSERGIQFTYLDSKNLLGTDSKVDELSNKQFEKWNQMKSEGIQIVERKMIDLKLQDVTETIEFRSANVTEQRAKAFQTALGTYEDEGPIGEYFIDGDYAPLEAKNKILENGNIIYGGEQEGIYLYTSRHYKLINSYLDQENSQASIDEWKRDSTSEGKNVTDTFVKEALGYTRFIAEMACSGMNKLPSYEGLLYRGAGMTDERLEEFRQGKVVMVKKFYSCSTNLDVCERFAKDSAIDNTMKTKKDYIPVLYVFKSQNAKDITEFSSVQSEEERLYMPGQGFRALKVDETTVPGLAIIYMEEMN